eukprot:TRINITY_DN9975_c0_g1_i1.p1 TRINITY_DN9975_c0_g1~~TRINITY_DN9975_c0_g1_i1.p1  ORF type:complete len:210 (-),score=34.02 TRINITY_DN9975_c0_g1_i1:303-839(-)
MENLDFNITTKQNMSYMHFAIYNNNDILMSYCLEKGNQFNSRSGESSLDIALKGKNWRFALILLESGCNDFSAKPYEWTDSTYLHREEENSSEEQLKCIEKLCELIDINTVNSQNWTPLHYAVSNSNIPLVKLFLTLGADPDICTVKEIHPLLTSLLLDNEQKGEVIFDLLIEKSKKH